MSIKYYRIANARCGLLRRVSVCQLYANFYIANKSVIVPTYRCAKDAIALDIIQKCFPDCKVIGIDSTDIIWGLGSFHCFSQQEPKI